MCDATQMIDLTQRAKGLSGEYVNVVLGKFNDGTVRGRATYGYDLRCCALPHGSLYIPWLPIAGADGLKKKEK